MVHQDKYNPDGSGSPRPEKFRTFSVYSPILCSNTFSSMHFVSLTYIRAKFNTIVL